MRSVKNPAAAEGLEPPLEIARRLKISRRSLHALTQPRGPVPAIRVGRLLRYKFDDVLAALDSEGRHR